MRAAGPRPIEVVWSPRTRATCPACETSEVGSYSTMPWEGMTRVRYHRCPVCGLRFKSTERDFCGEE